MRTTQHTPPTYKLNEARSNDFLIAITTADETENIGLVYRAPDKAKAIANAQFIVTACNWHDEAREALTEIAILCEADADKTNWQDILRRANSALEHLQSAQGKE